MLTRRSRLARWNCHLLMALTGLGFGPGAWSETVVDPEFTVAAAQSYLQAQSLTFQTQAGAGAETYFVLARLQNRLGHQDEAERLARQALERNPKLAEIHSFLGKILLSEDRLEEAAGCFRQALALAPRAAGDYRWLGMALDQLGDHEGSRKAYSAGLSLDPADASAHLMLGRLLLDQGDAREAIEHLDKACQLDGTLVNAFYVLAQAQTQIGAKAAAGETMKTFQRLRASANESLAAKDVDYDNEKEIRRIAAGFHDDAAAFFLHHGRPDLAEAHLKQAAKVAPEENEAYEHLAGFYVKTGAFAAAKEAYENLTRLRPNQALYRVRLATLLLRLKDDAAAEVELKKALELDPNQREALNYLAQICLEARRDLPEALSLCRRSVSLQPTAANYDLLALACYLNGRGEEARTAAAEALRLDPGKAEYQEHYKRLTEKP
ncbi:MAG: tetratricopeptide repeat protein [Limisphaerales bacterium]